MKAGTADDFQKKTGARAEAFELPFRALEYLQNYGIAHSVAAMSADPAIMPSAERRNLLQSLHARGEDIYNIDEENAGGFGITKKRLAQSGIADPDDINRYVYERLNTFAHNAKQFGRIGKDMLLRELQQGLVFKITDSPCQFCSRKDPWHGHGVEDDMDPKLK